MEQLNDPQETQPDWAEMEEMEQLPVESEVNQGKDKPISAPPLILDCKGKGKGAK